MYVTARLRVRAWNHEKGTEKQVARRVIEALKGRGEFTCTSGSWEITSGKVLKVEE